VSRISTQCRGKRLNRRDESDITCNTSSHKEIEGSNSPEHEPEEHVV